MCIRDSDYITKPFNPIEVIARVKSQLRRYTSLGGKQGGGEANPALLTNGGIALDDGAKSVTVDGEGVSPVSYTHLDVYKRQCIPSGLRPKLSPKPRMVTAEEPAMAPHSTRRFQSKGLQTS